MDTPIVDFLKGYQIEGMSRFHMPGHKGGGVLGCEGWDVTEIAGADSLYQAAGIIAQSERSAAGLFGAGRTLYSTEGSSQCIRAMLHLAVTCRAPGVAPVVLAARNVHKAFVFAAGLIGFDVEWLWPEGEGSLCACQVTPEGLEKALSGRATPPAAVYVTSPDYLGNLQDVAALAAVCHRHGTLLLVDNAHGAYLHFLETPVHPMDLGADLCCDSAHKTLPVLTGGAYLHIGKNAPKAMADGAKQAMSLYGSTSPSYLIMASLDACNAWLAGEGEMAIPHAAQGMAALKEELCVKGWSLTGQEPLKLALAAPVGWSGEALADLLRCGGVEPEYSDPEHVVLMASGSTPGEDFQRVADALHAVTPAADEALSVYDGARLATETKWAMSIRQAIFAPSETVPAGESLGRVCAAPTVACPPAIPIVVSGEIITPEALRLFRHYGVERVDVVKE